MIYNYQQAEAFLNQFILPLEPVANPNTFLDRFKLFLKMLGNPHQMFPSVIVSGTSGKGSTSFILASLLSNAGYKTGYTQSPHLEKLTERMQVGSQKSKAKNQKYSSHFVQTIHSISDKEFVDLLNEIIPIIEGMRSTELGVPSYYEILLAMAFLYFAKERVDIAVVEVGLEGKYDGTNVLDPIGFVLTNISLDHTNLLGDTIEKIAEEATYKIKDLRLNLPAGEAGIQDQKPFVVSGVNQKKIVRLIQNRAKESGSILSLLHRDFEYQVRKSSEEGEVFDFISSVKGKALSVKNISDIDLSLIGEYQAENATLAIETIVQLRNFGVKVSEEIMRRTFKHLFFPGRFEIANYRGPAAPHPRSTASFVSLTAGAQRGTPSHVTPQNFQFTVVLDGAHNSAKMQAFLSSLQNLFPDRKKIFMIAFSQGHDVENMLSQISRIADTIIVTQYGGVTDMGKNRSVANEKIKIKNEKFKRENIQYEKSSEKAMEKAIQLVQKNITGLQEPLLVVTGSLYLVGEVRQWLHRLHS
jgi:dihydrofolate synthase/folylpolyglutamate synthase